MRSSFIMLLCAGCGVGHIMPAVGDANTIGGSTVQCPAPTTPVSPTVLSCVDSDTQLQYQAVLLVDGQQYISMTYKGTDFNSTFYAAGDVTAAASSHSIETMQVRAAFVPGSPALQVHCQGTCKQASWQISCSTLSFN